ncbi:MAG: lipase maturation factor family protein [Myxococcota bacterium]|nr:lipase maturation factor family protein [Myxococcota bacterium]
MCRAGRSGGGVESEQVWGLFSRLLGLVFLISFASVTSQIRGLIGRRGIEPVFLLLQAVRRDLGVVRGAFRFPTLMWLSSSDAMLLGLAVAGMFASVGIICGLAQAYTWVLFLVVWACWLSIQNANTNLFWYPWDNLKTECALFGALLPGLAPLPQIDALEAPRMMVVFFFAWLLFRVMFGMGIAKFRGLDERTRKWTYIYHFLEWQPFPTAMAQYLRELPMACHKALLAGVWVVEIVIPFFVFGTSSMRLVACVLFVMFQIGIFVCGNYGVFNLLTAALACSLLATFEWTGWGAVSVLDGLLLGHVAISIIYLLCMTSWTSTVWLYMPSKISPSPRVRRAMAPVLGLLRLFAPFRIWNAYGVFIQRGNVPHQVAVLQSSTDGVDWVDLEPKWFSCDVKRRPPHFAPHQPRLDHHLFYQGFRPPDLKLACLMGTNPYYVDPHGFTEKLIQKLLHGDANAWGLLGYEVPAVLPRFIRHTAWHYHMLNRSERIEENAWWRRDRIGVGEAIQAEALEETAGIRGTYDPFVFDRFVMVDNEVLAFIDAETGAYIPLNKHAVVTPSARVVPKSRSVVGAITTGVES